MSPTTTVPEAYLDILESKGFAHTATIGPNGAPQSTPVWFLWDGGQLRFSLTKTRQKYKNLVRAPHVSLSISDNDNPYRYVEVRGTVSIEEDPEKAFINRISNKYLGKDYPWNQPDDERVVVTVHPTRVVTQG